MTLEIMKSKGTASLGDNKRYHAASVNEKLSSRKVNNTVCVCVCMESK